MKAQFVTRDLQNMPSRDYISEANEILRAGGVLDPNSPLYQNALDQYNAQLSQGVTERLEVPVGFCGYIDPDTGLFRVEPDIIPPELRMPILFPDEEVDPSDVQPLSAIPYPIDQCLQHGLPGSYEYTRFNCGEETGDDSCSPVKWFSGAGTSSDFGTDALEQSVCGVGPGINSNKGLANSDPIGGVSPGFPEHVKQHAHEIALSLYPPRTTITVPGIIGDDIEIDVGYEIPYTGAGWVAPLTNVRNLLGSIITHSFFYNVHDPTESREHWRQAGLRVSVSWDTTSGDIVGDDYERMWLWENIVDSD